MGITDKDGQDLRVGDRVTVACVITAVRDEDSTPGTDVHGNLDLRVADVPEGTSMTLSMLNGENVAKA